MCKLEKLIKAIEDIFESENADLRADIYSCLFKADAEESALNDLINNLKALKDK